MTEKRERRRKNTQLICSNVLVTLKTIALRWCRWCACVHWLKSCREKKINKSMCQMSLWFVSANILLGYRRTLLFDISQLNTTVGSVSYRRHRFPSWNDCMYAIVFAVSVWCPNENALYTLAPGEVGTKHKHTRSHTYATHWLSDRTREQILYGKVIRFP